MTLGNELCLIIHSHFYQPPREDPWTGSIERQESAWPFHDWNERIDAECYAANANARTLNLQGRIVDIINNYEFISFNFGPTLLTWLERYDPATYEKVLAADIASAERNAGHGNAIAQVYNHLLMPLANPRDKYTQVLWGLADFEIRFGRRSEGLWLAESAVNIDTLEVLADCGIKFVVLSPTQAATVRQLEGGQALDVSHNNIDTSQAYLATTRYGDVAIFFYDLDISRAVGFEHLLTDVEHYRNRFLHANRPEKPVHMVNIATDGESYGHHEPFANMCLAKLIYDNFTRREFVFTNYGAFLERFPPSMEVLLKEGNNQLGTAWSCSHGVGRWMEDCGCKTGGEPHWHQQWRTPLRAAFDILRDNIADRSEELTKPLLSDFWDARDAYIDFLLRPSDPARRARFFAEQALRPLTAEEETLVLTLLQAQLYALYMYTSCAWFFSEISGLETVQCLRYAARALQLMGDLLPEKVKDTFCATLELAPSNLPRFGNGRRVYEELVEPYVFDDRRTVHERTLERLLIEPLAEPVGGTFGVHFSDLRTERRERGQITRAEATLECQGTGRRDRYLVYVIRRSRLGFVSYVKQFQDERLKEYLDELVASSDIESVASRMTDWFPRAYTLHDLRRETRERILSEIFKDAFQEMQELRSQKLPEYLELVEFYARLQVAVPAVERANLEATFNNEIAHQIQRLEGAHGFDFDRVSRMLEAAERTGLAINRDLVAQLFRVKLREYLDGFLATRTRETFDILMRLIRFTNRVQLEFRRTYVEDRVFAVLHLEAAPLLEDRTRKRTPEEMDFVERVVRLAEELNIHAVHFRNLLEEVAPVGGGPEALQRSRRPARVQQAPSL